MVNKYFSADNLPGRRTIPGGDGTNPHYRLDPVTDMVIRDGDDDLQSMIDAAEGSVNINKIIERYRASGDPAILQQRQYMYGDLEVKEGSYQQLVLLSNQLRQIYDGLSPEDRAKVGEFDRFASFLAQEPQQSAAPSGDGSITIGGVTYVPQASQGSSAASSSSAASDPGSSSGSEN